MKNRNALLYIFASRMAYDMDGDSLMIYASEKLQEDYAKLSDDELLAEIADFYPDLLEEV
jgi:hypothetical protein